MKKEIKNYDKGFQDGWKEAIAWIEGDFDLEKEEFSKKQFVIINNIFTKWFHEWKNSVKLLK